MTRLFGFSLLNAAIVLFLLPCAAFAGGEATLIRTESAMQAAGQSFGGGETTETVSWRDVDTVRVDEDQAHYSLLRDGKKYWVDQSQAEAKVMETPLIKADPGAQSSGKNPFSIEATGASETVAGIEGRVYHVTITIPNMGTKDFEAVYTDDPLVVEMTHAYFNAMGGMWATGPFQASLPDDDRGLLRKDDELRLDSISRAEPPASTFKLPAQPVN